MWKIKKVEDRTKAANTKYLLWRKAKKKEKNDMLYEYKTII